MVAGLAPPTPMNPAQRAVLEGELDDCRARAETLRLDARPRDALLAREVASDLAATLHGETSREMAREAYELGLAHLDCGAADRALSCLQHALSVYAQAELGKTRLVSDSVLLADIYIALGNALACVLFANFFFFFFFFFFFSWSPTVFFFFSLFIF
jgi:hypothetical protein